MRRRAHQRVSRNIQRRMAMKRRAYLNRMAAEPLSREEMLGLALGPKDDKETYVKDFLKVYPEDLHEVKDNLRNDDVSGLNFESVKFSQMGIKGNNLKQTNFSDCQLRAANFDGMTLTQAIFEGAKLEFASFVNSTVSFGKFDNACLVGTNFSGADLNAVVLNKPEKIKNVVFSGAKLGNVWIDDGIVDECLFDGVTEILSVSGTEFKNTHLSGITFKDSEALKECTFSPGTKLRNITYAGDFGSGATLETLDFSRAILNKTSANNASFAGSFFIEAELKETDWGGSDFSGAVFRQADFTKAKLQRATFEDQADLTATKMIEADLTNASFDGATLAYTDFTGATLTNATFSGAQIAQIKLGGADLSGVSLGGVNLSRVNLQGATFSNTDFSDSSLERATLTKTTGVAFFISAKLNQANANNATLAGSKMQDSQAVRAQFIGADLRNVDFQGADLREADFTKAKLQGADFRGANLEGAKLDGASIEATDFTGVDLSSVSIKGVKSNRKTKWDVGFFSRLVRTANEAPTRRSSSSSRVAQRFAGLNRRGADFMAEELEARHHHYVDGGVRDLFADDDDLMAEELEARHHQYVDSSVRDLFADDDDLFADDDDLFADDDDLFADDDDFMAEELEARRHQYVDSSVRDLFADDYDF